MGSSGKHRYGLEALESRILMSGDPVGTASGLGGSGFGGEISNGMAAAVEVLFDPAERGATGLEETYPGAVEAAGIFPVELASVFDGVDSDGTLVGDAADGSQAVDDPTAEDETPNADAANEAVDSEAEGADPENETELLAATIPDAPDLPGLELSDPDLSGLIGQVFFLDFDGAEGVEYNGPVTLSGLSIPAFAAPGALAGQEVEIIGRVVDTLNHLFEGISVTFTTRGPPSSASTIYVGGSDRRFSKSSPFRGLAEQIDVGNASPSDEALVFSDNLPGTGKSIEEYSGELADVVAHEAGRLLGYRDSSMADEGDVSGDPLRKVAALATELGAVKKWWAASGEELTVEVTAFFAVAGGYDFKLEVDPGGIPEWQLSASAQAAVYDFSGNKLAGDFAFSGGQVRLTVGSALAGRSLIVKISRMVAPARASLEAVRFSVDGPGGEDHSVTVTFSSESSSDVAYLKGLWSRVVDSTFVKDFLNLSLSKHESSFERISEYVFNTHLANVAGPLAESISVGASITFAVEVVGEVRVGPSFWFAGVDVKAVGLATGYNLTWTPSWDPKKWTEPTLIPWLRNDGSWTLSRAIEISVIPFKAAAEVYAKFDDLKAKDSDPITFGINFAAGVGIDPQAQFNIIKALGIKAVGIDLGATAGIDRSVSAEATLTVGELRSKTYTDQPTFYLALADVFIPYFGDSVWQNLYDKSSLGILPLPELLGRRDTVLGILNASSNITVTVSLGSKVTAGAWLRVGPKFGELVGDIGVNIRIGIYGALTVSASLPPTTMKGFNVVSALAGVDEAAGWIDRSRVGGVTIVTHGFQPGGQTDLLGQWISNGDSLYPLAKKIRDYSDGWLLDYELRSLDGDSGYSKYGSFVPSVSAITEPREVVLLFDWAAESRERSAGWGETAGDALFAQLVGLGLIDPSKGSANPPLHFIAHSFGSAVTSEAVERLAAYGVPVDHLTYLDPHDFDQGSESWIPKPGDLPVDGPQRLYDLGLPQLSFAPVPGRSYGATVWNNVEFADVYYQVTPFSLLDPSTLFDPDGRPIPGAFNVDVTGIVTAMDTESGTHSRVWDALYAGTIPEPGSPTTGLARYGYGWSRLARGEGYRPSEPRFLDASKPIQTQGGPAFALSQQDLAVLGHELNHQWTSRNLVFDAGGRWSYNPSGLQAETLTFNQLEQGHWEPQWRPLVNGVTNGGFANGASASILPGWLDHGGGGSGRILKEDGGARTWLELTPSASSKMHNYFYLPVTAGILRFTARGMGYFGVGTDTMGQLVATLETADGRRHSTSVGLDDSVLGLAGRSVPLAVPLDLRGGIARLHLELKSVSDPVRVLVDNIRFEAGGAGGDLLAVDLDEVVVAPRTGYSRSIEPTDEHRLFFTVGGAQPVDVTENSSRHDLLLTIGGRTLGYVIFSERTDRERFENSGEFYLAVASDNGLPGDQDVSTPGFQGEISLTYSYKTVSGGFQRGQQSVTFTVLAGFTGQTRPATAASAGDVLRIAQLQQRLNHFGYRDYEDAPLVVDGIVGSRTESATTDYQSRVVTTGVLPADVRLTATASFSVVINLSVPITVSVGASGNSGLASLVIDLNNALTSAHLNGLIVAYVHGDRISLNATGAASGRQFSVVAAVGNPAVTVLRLPTSTTRTTLAASGEFDRLTVLRLNNPTANVYEVVSVAEGVALGNGLRTLIDWVPQLSSSGPLNQPIPFLSQGRGIDGAADLDPLGRLSGVATFLLRVGGQSAVTVLVPVDRSNISRNNLVDDVNEALAAAGLADRVTASLNGGKLRLSPIGKAASEALEVLNPNSVAEQELHLVGIGEGSGTVRATLGGEVGIPAAFDEHLGQRVNAYLANPGSGEATVSGLASFLNTGTLAPANANAGANTVTLTASVVGSPDQGGFAIEILLSVTRTVSRELLFGETAQRIGLSLNGKVMLDVTYTLTIGVTLGVDRDALASSGDGFYLRLSSLGASATIDATELNLTGRIGILGLQLGPSGELHLSAGVTLTLNNPDGDADGRITMGELLGTPLSSLIGGVTTTGTLDGFLPVSAKLGGLEIVSTTLLIGLDGDNFFNGAIPLIVPEDSQLLNFGGWDSGDLAGWLAQLRDWFDQLRGSPTFDVAMPFAKALGLGDRLDLAGAVSDTINSLLVDEGGTPRFLTLQEMFEKVAAFSGGTYNAATRELTFQVEIDQSFESGKVQLDLSQGLGRFADISTSAEASLSGRFRTKFTAGMILAPFDRGFRFTLRDGSRFDVDLDGAIDLADVQARVATASGNRVSVELDGNSDRNGRYVLRTTTAGSQPFKVEIIRGYEGLNGQPALTLVKAGAGAVLTDVQLAADSLAEHFFLRFDRSKPEEQIEASLTLAVTDLDAVARLGFAEVTITNGTGNVGARLSLKPGDPGQGARADGRISLAELFESLGNDAVRSALFGPIGFSGSATMVLPLGASLLNLNLPGKPEAIVSWTDFTKPETLRVEFNEDAREYLRFLEMDYASGISAAFGQLKGYFGSLSALELLTTRLPIINRSILDLAGLEPYLGDILRTLDKEGAAVTVVQALDQALKSAFGSAATVEVTLEGIGSDRALKLHLEFGRTSTLRLPVDLSLTSLNIPGIGSLVDVGGKALIDVGLKSHLTLDLGIDLSNPSSPRAFVYDSTTIELRAKFRASNLDFSAALGPMGLFVEDGSVVLEGANQNRVDREYALVRVYLDGRNGDDRHYFTESILNDTRLEIDGKAEAVLPLYFPTRSQPLGGTTDDLTGANGMRDGVPDHQIVYRLTDLGSPIANSSLVTPSLATVINDFHELAGNLGSLVDGWDGAWALLDQILAGRVFGVELPFISDKLKDSLRFIRDLRARVLDNFNNLGASLAVEFIQRAFYDALGPGGLDWLKDSPNDADEVVTKEDVTYALITGLDGRVKEVRFDLQLGQSVQLVDTDTAIDFDVGIPGLGFSLEGAVRIMLGFELNLTFGVSKTEGFYLGVGGENELRVFLDARIPGLKGTGRLGFLTISAEDDNPEDPAERNQSRLTGLFAVNLKDPSGDGHLTLNELRSNLSNPGQLVSATFATRAAAVWGSQPAHVSWPVINGDASMNVSVDGGMGRTVVIRQAAVAGNVSLADLIQDVNASIALVPELAGKFRASAQDGRLVLTHLQGGYFRLSGIASGNPAATQLFLQNGLSMEQNGPSGPALINLDLRATIGTGMPALIANFSIEWGFDSADTSAARGTFGGVPKVRFGEVGMVLGEFFGNLLGPVLDKIKTIIEPVRPVVEILLQPIPVLSNLAGRPVRLLDLAKSFGLAEAEEYIEAAGDVLDLIDLLPTGPDVATRVITFGSFQLDGDIRQASSLAEARRKPEAEEVRDIYAQLEAPSAEYLERTKGVQSKDGQGMAFPLLDDPSQAFKLLMGQDIVLFTYDMPTLEINFSYTWRSPIPVLPPFPIFAQITGFISASAHFSFGYDTSGLRSAFKSGQTVRALDGFYVSDRRNPDGTGADVPEVTLKGGLYAGAELWTPPSPLEIKAGVAGGIFATINFNLHDPDNDGKVRLQELEQSLKGGILNVFDVDGSLDARLVAYLKLSVDVPFVGNVTLIDIFKEIVNITLLDFNFERSDETPVLAELDAGSGTLWLNLGDRAGRRAEGNTSDGNETFSVRPGATPNQVVVDAFGRSQTFSGVSRIVAHGGAGNDTITIDSRVTVPVTLSGGDGNDRLTAGGGAATLRGGRGNDALTGGESADVLEGDEDDDVLVGDGGADVMRGGAGRDRLDGGAGNDQMFGDADDDELTGGFGADELRGGSGDDTLRGSEDNDTLWGEAGRDYLLGGLDNDRLDGGLGNDRLLGEEGADYIRGGDDETTLEDNDDLVGGPGNDEMYGGAGHDVLRGEAGNDQLDGGWGDDQLFGGLGSDVISGGPDRDLIYAGETSQGADLDSVHTLRGGSGDDEIFGDLGADAIYGDGGSDYIEGGWGADTIYAGSTAAGGGSAGDVNVIYGDSRTAEVVSASHGDVIYGDIGRDVIFGQLGRDVVLALAGDDELRGDEGDDSLYGEAGNDSIDGGAGNDYVNGGDGADLLFGGLNDDEMVGGEGNDQMSGDEGNDLLFGGAAAFGRLNFETAGFASDGLTPQIVVGLSVEGAPFDGRDTLLGGPGKDWLFGGSDEDQVDGGAEADYGDGGAGNDRVAGGDGDDFIRGGRGSDILRGGVGIDLVYGDEGDDLLFGDAGTDGVQAGQSLHGGAGNDTLHAYAPESAPFQAMGDELYGDAGNDWLYGNLRQDHLEGGDGKDYLGGDALAGPNYAYNLDAARKGANDRLIGGSGEDQLYGGGGDDDLFGGPDSDWLDGQDGHDCNEGGLWNDIIVLDVDPTYPNAGDTVIDGHGSITMAGGKDDNATDILYILGTDGPDEIFLGQAAPSGPGLASASLRVIYNGRAIDAEWRADSGRADKGSPLVEQFYVAGLGGNDTLVFAQAGGYDGLTFVSDAPGGPKFAWVETSNAGRVKLYGLDVADLAGSRSDWIGNLDGGAGDDKLWGSASRDQLDGGQGGDWLYGMGGDDRIWGDRGDGNPDDRDRLFGGQGNDDLLGGSGKSWLYPWTRDPMEDFDGIANTVIEPEFGIFVRPDGSLVAGSGDLYSLDGLREKDGKLDRNPSEAAYPPEDTGINRVLGSTGDDLLYGGTGLDFLYGNGGEDVIYDRTGHEFGDRASDYVGFDSGQDAAWKDYARSTDKVWYVGGSNANDVINVDFVTEPGLLEGHHLITRLTNNNGNFTFAAQVRLDFKAVDADGRAIWNPANFGLRLDALNTRDLEARGEALSDPIDDTDLEMLFAIPAEGNYLAIIIDALDGDDVITVGPTVQKTVWVDGGRGDDRIQILTGNAILVDQTEQFVFDGQARRNDSETAPYPLSVVRVDAGADAPDLGRLPAGVAAAEFRLKLNDEPPVLVRLAAAATADNRSVADLVNDLNAVIYNTPLAGRVIVSYRGERLFLLATEGGTGSLQVVGSDGELGFNPMPAPATGLALARTTRFSGLTLDNPGDVDWYRFNVAAPTVAGDYFWLQGGSPNDQFTVSFYTYHPNPDDSKSGTVSAIANATFSGSRGILSVPLPGITTNPDVTYVVKVQANGVPTVYDMSFVFAGSPDRTEPADDTTATPGLTPPAFPLGDLTNVFEVTGGVVQSPGDVDTFTFTLEAPALSRWTATGDLPTDGLLPAGSQARFTVTLSNGQTIPVTIEASKTGDNDDVADVDARIERLVDDVNNALREAKLDTLLRAGLNGRRLVLGVVESAAGLRFQLSVTRSDPAVTHLKLPYRHLYVRNLDAAAGFTVELRDKDGTLIGPAALELSLELRELDLSGLALGESYQIRVSAPIAFGRYELVPALANQRARGLDGVNVLGAAIDLTEYQTFSFTNAALTLPLQRRDVLLGGEGNDVLMGGPGEDWIFGGDGNDVLSGGRDRQFSDLMFGGDGDDAFQLIPDALPVLTGTSTTYVPTFYDLMFGGDGDNQVLFLGGDLDVAGQLVPDHVSIRFNSVLHRYEFTSLIWDTQEQRYVKSTPAGVSPADVPFEREYLFFQVRDVQFIVFDGRAGNDEIHADPGYHFDNDPSEWGISAGDRQQGAPLVDLILRGGDGNDRLFGGVGDDLMEGGSGVDVIQGNAGSDTLRGDDGLDIIEGYVSTVPDRYEVTGANGRERNDSAVSAALLQEDFGAFLRGGGGLYPVRAEELTFHRGDLDDWYYFEAPPALSRYGVHERAMVLRSMLEVRFNDLVLRPVFQDMWNRALAAFESKSTDLAAADQTLFDGPRFLLYAGVKTGSVIRPVDQYEGVPEYYFVRVSNPASRAILATAGVLPSWDAVNAEFEIRIDNGPARLVSVPFDPQASNEELRRKAEGPGGLLALINAALSGDPNLAGRVEAVLAGGRLALVLRNGGGRLLEIRSVNPIAASQLYLEEGLSSEVAPASGTYELLFKKDIAESTAVSTVQDTVRITSNLPADRPAPIPAGDVDGDGYADFLALAEETAAQNTYKILFGQAGFDNSEVELKAGDPSIRVEKGPGETVLNFAAGDFNADGRSDLAVGIVRTVPAAGIDKKVLVLLGRERAAWSRPLLVSADPAKAFEADHDMVIGGLSSSGTTLALASAGNVNGVPGDELLIGDAAANSGAGAVYLFSGTAWVRRRELMRAGFGAGPVVGLPDGFTKEDLAGNSLNWNWNQYETGQWGFYFGNPATGNYDLPGSRVAGRMTPGLLNVDALANGTGLQIRFDYLLQTENAASSGFDRALVEFSTDGFIWKPLAANFTGAPLPEPPQLTIGDTAGSQLSRTNLILVNVPANYAGPLRVRFTFDSGDAVNNTRRGWIVDNILLRSTPITLSATAPNSTTQTRIGGTTGQGLGTAVAGVGRFNDDSFRDFAVTAAGGAARLFVVKGAAALPTTLTGAIQSHAAVTLPASYRLFGVGDLNGDGRDDVLISGDDESRLIGGTNALVLLRGTEVMDVPLGNLVPLGDIGGYQKPGAPGQPALKYADLGSSELERTDKLITTDQAGNSEGGYLWHEVGRIYFGGDAALSAAHYAAPNLRVEPRVPLYFATTDTNEPAGVGLTRLIEGVASAIGDSLRDWVVKDSPAGAGLNLVTGVVSAAVIAPAPVEFVRENQFQFRLSAPLTADDVTRPLGVDLANGGSQRLDEAVGLAGSVELGQLSEPQGVGDVNGDTFEDFLFTADKAARAYLIFGPIQLTSLKDISLRADVVFDLNIFGRPAGTMGDIDGQGQDDLVFVQRVGAGDAWVRILWGESLGRRVRQGTVQLTDVNGDGVVDGDVTIRIQTTASRWSDAGLRVSADVLRWNEDAFADLVVTVDGNAASSTVGYAMSGATLAAGGNLTEQNAWFAIHRAAEGDRYQNRVLGDVNGDGLDDLGVATTATSDLPSVYRVYLLLGQPGAAQFPVTLGGNVDGRMYRLTPDMEGISGASIAGLSPLGDLNRDGYDDFAVVRAQPNPLYTWAKIEDKVLVYSARATDPATGRVLDPLSFNAPLGLVRTGVLGAGGLAVRARLAVTAGDFTGDGVADLAVLQSEGLVTSLDPEQPTLTSGDLFLFENAPSRSGNLNLSQADRVVTSSGRSGFADRLIRTPGLDANGDRIHDLWLGASRADVVGEQIQVDAGAVYLLLGNGQKVPDWAESEERKRAEALANRTFEGSSLLVASNPGQVVAFTRHLDPETYDAWFRFTFAGDALPGSFLSVGPRVGGSADLYATQGGSLSSANGYAVSRSQGQDLLLGGANRDVALLEFDLSAYLGLMAGPAEALAGLEVSPATGL